MQRRRGLGVAVAAATLLFLLCSAAASSHSPLAFVPPTPTSGGSAGKAPASGGGPSASATTPGGLPSSGPAGTAAVAASASASGPASASRTRMAASKKKGGGSGSKAGGGSGADVKELLKEVSSSSSSSSSSPSSSASSSVPSASGSGGSGGRGSSNAKMKTPPPTATRADFGPGAPAEALGDRESEEEHMFHQLQHLGEEHNSAIHLRRLRSLGKYPVLVLNADCSPLSYLPLSIIRWQDAIKAIFLDRVMVLDYYDSYIQSTAGPWQLPSVICLKEYQKAYQQEVVAHLRSHRLTRQRTPPLNRRNVYMRDRYECAYCLSRLKAQDLSLDHVVPRALGGKSTWDNLVTCCRTCNRKKGKRTVKELKEIGMTLMNPPRRPSMAEIQGIARHFRTTQGLVHSTWTPYLGMKEESD